MINAFYQCVFDHFWRCQQPILDVLLVLVLPHCNKCCQEADANPQATTLGYFATGQASVAPCCSVLHLLDFCKNILAKDLPTAFQSVTLYDKEYWQPRLRVVFHQCGKGNSVGTNPRSHPLVGKMQAKRVHA